MLLLGSDADGWHVPRFDAYEDATANILDVCNVMGSVVTQAHERLGIRLPWLSWLTDAAHDDDGAWRCRVLAVASPGGSHRLLMVLRIAGLPVTSWRLSTKVSCATAKRSVHGAHVAEQRTRTATQRELWGATTV